MGQLSRNGGRPLLRQVNGKKHASKDDHEESESTTPLADTSKRTTKTMKPREEEKEAVEEDWERDPDSTSEEEPMAPEQEQLESRFVHRQIDVPSKPPDKRAGFVLPKTISPSSAGSKRSAEESDSKSSPNDDPVFMSQPGSSQPRHNSPEKRHKPKTLNIHAPRNVRQYGTKAQIKSQKAKKEREAREEKLKGMQKPKAREGPAFMQPRGGDMRLAPRGIADFKAPQGGDRGSRSPSLSSLTSLDSDIEEIDATQLGPDSYICGICNIRLLLETLYAFETSFPKANIKEYKYQKWFCGYHRSATAREVWKERGYPDIDWLKLDERVERHHEHLLGVLEGSKPSIYRDRLRQQLDSGDGKSALSAFTEANNQDGQSSACTPGYYGPRGEKLVMEHVTTHFAKRLRELATTDPLIASFGVKGGVSGFTQSVLVPELLVSLVMEDMKVGPSQARDMLQNSKELGELLSQEVNERRG
jgi:hypothetical protein